MSILIDEDIKVAVGNGSLIIKPFFAESRVAEGRSYGLSVCSYDVRLRQSMWLWPFWGRKGSIIEYISMPLDLRGKIENKSTNARLFIDASQGTNIEPGWFGTLTIEITRGLPWPIFLRAGTPIASIVFEELTRPVKRGYNGKYQAQGVDPVAAIFEKGSS